MKKQKLKKIEFVLLLIVIVQILLLFNMAFAQSYIIHQTDDIVENSKIIKKGGSKFKNLISSGINLLVGLLSIKQIGFVSAQVDIEDVEMHCCLDTCDPIISTNVGDCEKVIQTSCDSTYECELGCCYDSDEGLCTESSPRGDCIDNGGEWNNDETCSMSNCQNGCCILGGMPSFKTEGWCEKADGIFKQIYNEYDCLFLSTTQFEGACIKDDMCTFKTEELCLSMGGKPYTGYLCSYPELNTGCEKQVDVGCVEGKDEIYWFDSCGNRENIYNSNGDASWNGGKVLLKELSCDLWDGNTNSKICGNCARPFSKCSKTEIGQTHIQDGDFICKDLKCIDAPSNVGTQNRFDGESWCLYDGYIGDGKDTVGSEHWIAYCHEGEVEVDRCDSGYRGYLCQQQETEEGGKTFSKASCVLNQGSLCITEYNPLQENVDDETVDNEENIQKCIDNKHCMIKNIDMGEYFKFSMCVPRYAKGAILTNGVDDNVCSTGSTTCTMVYEKQLSGWECIENCNCTEAKFAEQMNDLCTSLGDCGSYVNYIGVGTDNVEIEGKKGVELDSKGETDKQSSDKANAPDIFSWINYANNAKPVEGQYVEPQDIDEFLTQIGGSGGEYEVTNYDNALMWMGAIPGAVGGVIAGLAWAFGSTAAVTTAGAISTVGVGGLIGPGLSAFGTAAMGAALGVAAGVGLAKLLGISGEAAIVLAIAGGVMGAALGVLSVVGLGGASQGWNPVGWVMLIIAALMAIVMGVIAILGLGKLETRIVEFTCMPWQAPTGEADCETCNEDPLRPCTKYRCESLGQTCKILNEDEENPPCNQIEYETNPPVITSGEILIENYQFENEQTKSVNIISTDRSDGCIPEFTSVYFNLETDEPAQCKYSFYIPPAYEEMENNYPFEQNAFTEKHTFDIWMPSLDSLDVYNLTEDLQGISGNINMYVKCQDYWENSNIDTYIVKFCINSGPDGTAVNHALTTTDPKNEATLKYGTSETDFEMWINEPADCRYDVVSGKDYEEMSYGMTCSDSIYKPHLFGWPCETELTNLVGGANKFYFKCKDKPWADTPEEIKEFGGRNTNKEDYEYTLHVSANELKMDSISFSTIVSDKTISISSGETFDIGRVSYISVDMEVKTSGGADNGNANCYWGVLEDGSRSLMSPYDTLTNIHTQLLTPRFPATHINYIECEDNAGNTASSVGEFTIIIDSDEPEIVRAYYENGKLKLLTNEIAQCYYDFNICGFNINEETLKFESVGYSTEHKTDWIVGQIYYVKCEDIWGNLNPECMRIIPSS
ncbi:hypothetical protein KAR52_01370 [Candidatus Pacearchaeota archaeon]|nr:hypothetical protein [Candidatus Pacearchaeota archaeon]